MSSNKAERTLDIYIRLSRGYSVRKMELANKFGVSEKTIQRDIEDIRNSIYNDLEGNRADIVYDYTSKSYRLRESFKGLSKEGALAITKILLESRAFCTEELKYLTDGILMQIDRERQSHVRNIIGNELLNYAELKHGKFLLDTIWDISEYIRSREVLEIEYRKMNGDIVHRKVRPVAIIFSEYYFYLVAYFEDYESPAVFRTDRIERYSKTGEKYVVPEKKRFEDGEFRKRIQFMYPGKLLRIKFEFRGASLEAVVDRLPTARVIEKVENGHILEAEVYGKGIKMWLLSQGANIKVLEPKDMAEEMRREAEALAKLYGGE